MIPDIHEGSLATYISGLRDSQKACTKEADDFIFVGNEMDVAVEVVILTEFDEDPESANVAEMSSSDTDFTEDEEDMEQGFYNDHTHICDLSYKPKFSTFLECSDNIPQCQCGVFSSPGTKLARTTVASMVDSNSDTPRISPNRLLIFECEEPRIIENENELYDNQKIALNAPWTLDVGAMVEVSTMPYEPAVEILPEQELTEISPVATRMENNTLTSNQGSSVPEGTKEGAMTSEEAVDIMDPLDMETDTLGQFWNPELLLPVVKQGSGFDLIDFINSDFSNDDITTSSSVTSSGTDDKTMDISFLSTDLGSDVSEPVGMSCNLPIEVNVEPPMTSSRRSTGRPVVSKQKSRRADSSSSTSRTSSSSVSKRPKELQKLNNIAAKICRQKQKEVMKMKFRELEKLTERNIHLKEEKEELEESIKRYLNVIKKMKKT